MEAEEEEEEANNDNESESDKSELEEGQVSSDDGLSDDSFKEFNDGFDDDLMAGEEDKARLQALPEKERETEIFNRSERRDTLFHRWEIEMKIRAAKRAVKKKVAGPQDKKKKEEKRKLREQKKAEEAAAGKQNRHTHTTQTLSFRFQSNQTTN